MVKNSKEHRQLEDSGGELLPAVEKHSLEWEQCNFNSLQSHRLTRCPYSSVLQSSKAEVCLFVGWLLNIPATG